MDRNDPRVKIPTLQVGQPITESYLRKISQGINDRRGVSNPPRQVLLPRGQGSVFVEMKGWVEVDQATPSTVGTKKGSRCTLFGNADNNYAGSSNTVKLAYQLASPQPTYLNGTLICGSGYTTATVQALKCTWSVNSATGQAQARVRARAILSSFDYTTLTWNGVSSLTLGSTGSASEIIFADCQTIASTNTLQLFSAGTGTNVANQMLVFNFPDGLASTVYGFLIEVMPKVTGQTNITLEQSSLLIDLMTTSATRPRWYSASA